MTMNPKERLLGAVADLQRFVIHHPDQARCPVCPRWDELQGAAMQAVTAIDDHKAELAALRAERAITASPWRYKEWGGLVVGGGEGSAEVLICTMATNTRHDEGRHNRELIIEAPTLRARLDKAEAEAARLRATLLDEAEYCYGYARKYESADEGRAARHRERGDRLKRAALGER